MKKKTKAKFEEGLTFYFQKRFVEAAKAFDKVLQMAPNDRICLHYRDLSTQYIVEGVPENWTGIEAMSYK